MNFNRLPLELQYKIIDYLIYPCHICKERYYDMSIKKCFKCKQYVCDNHYYKEINSVICQKCFQKKYESYIEDLGDLFNMCTFM